MSDDTGDGQGNLDDQVAVGELVTFASPADIRLLDDRSYETVEIPEWSHDGQKTLVRVRGLTGAERDGWEASLLRDGGGGRGRPKMDYSDLRAKLIVRCWVDGDGQRVCRDSDAQWLTQKSASALQRIFEVCQKLSRLTDEDVDELTGNSPGRDQNEENGSGSPTTFASL